MRSWIYKPIIQKMLINILLLVDLAIGLTVKSERVGLKRTVKPY